MIIGCLTFCACEDGISPVESIAVTSMPVTEYYRGDYFNLNNAVVTVYYENGRVESVPLTESMISDFDSQTVGEQVLAVRYGDAVTYLTVNVRQAPIRTVTVLNGDFKTTYVQGQSLDVSNMFLKVEYTNGYSETVAVTESMVGNFETVTSGYKRIAVTYGGYTVYVDITVVSKSIANLEVRLSERMSYVVGDKIDFEGVSLFVAYNNNTDEYIPVTTLLEDDNFAFYIHDEKIDVFDRARDMEYVTLAYCGNTVEYIVTVAPLKATGWEFISLPADQPMNSAKPDWSAGRIKISYNNGTTKEVGMDDESVEVAWSEFETDIAKDGKHTIFITCADIKKEYEITVVEAVEKELIVDVGDCVYYQDGEDIDVTEWHYSVLLTNGNKRKFSDGNTENPSVEVSMLVGECDLTTAVSGERLFTFKYVNPAGNITLQTTVTVEVTEKVMVGVKNFTAPQRTVYNLNDTLNLTGGGFYPIYNDGTEGEFVMLASDMVVGDVKELTARLAAELGVKLMLKDLKYAGEVEEEFVISVVNAVSSIAYNAAENDKLKTVYVLGEEFDSEGMVITINYPDGTRGSALNFDGREWSFENYVLNSVGNMLVRVYYGDRGDGIFADIPVEVTNYIEKFEFAEDFGGDFGDVTEGMRMTVPANAKLVITRQNGDKEEVTITADALDYDRSVLTLGSRSVGITYLNYNSATTPAIPLGRVNVVARKIVAVTVESLPAKQTYVIADADWAFDGLVLAVRYDNGNVLQIRGNRLTDGTNDGNYVEYSVSLSDRSLKVRFDKLLTEWGEAKYNRQTVNVRVTDVTTDATSFAENGYEIVCFEKEITNVVFVSSNIEAFEMEELVFPDDAAVVVTYKDELPETVFVKDMLPDDYTYTGFDKMKAGNQSVEFEYLLNKCSFTVNVKAKILAGIAATPEKITILEGVPISSDDISVKLHYVKNDGSEYGAGYWRDVEFGNVNCTYDPYANFLFDSDDGVGYTEKEYEISYSLGGVTVKQNITVRTDRKTALSAAMQTYPKQVYVEGESEFSLANGRVLIKYNNGTSEVIDLENSNRPDVSIVGNRLDPDLELRLGAEIKQVVTITFVDANNRKVDTSYSFTVKDRKYASVVFDKTPVNDTFLVEYGTNEAQGRPTFVVKGYINFNDANASDLTDNSVIDSNPKYKIYYRDENGVDSETWPTQSGVYTFIVEYEGDAVNNAFIDGSHKIEVYAKRLIAVAVDREFTFGDSYLNGSKLFDWVFIGTDNSVNPYRCGDTKEKIAVIGYKLYNGLQLRTEFFTDGKRTVVNAAAGEYELRPELTEMLPNEYGKINYFISEFRSGTVTVNARPIAIVGGEYDKFYGDGNPAFGIYKVYDYDKTTGEVGALLGENGVITLGEVYTDTAWNRYSLGRDDLGEDVGTYTLRSNDSFISNYEVPAGCYTAGILNINPRPITVTASQTGQRKYGQSVPESEEYAFALADGFRMGWDDDFEDIFAYLQSYKTYFEDGLMEIFVYEDYENNVGQLAFAPTATHDAGNYKISIRVTDELAKELSGNYKLTIDVFDFTVDKMDAKIELKSKEYIYSQFTETVEDGAISAAYRYADCYEIIFAEGDNYSLPAPVIALEKVAGTDTGAYQISVSQQSIDDNYNFVFEIYGDYGEYFERFFADKESVAQHMKKPSFADEKKAYAIILPYEFEFDFARTEVYDRVEKQNYKPAVTFDFGDGSFDEDTENALVAAMKFSFINEDPLKTGAILAADAYQGTVKYDFLHSATSRNFVVKTLSDEALARVYTYCFTEKNSGAQTGGEDVIYSYDFGYEITQKPLNVYVTNETVGYSGEAIPLDINDYVGRCEGDVLNISFDVSVLYNARTEWTTMRNPTSVINSGVYKASIMGLGNDNYKLSEEADGKITEFSVNAIVLNVMLKNANADGEVHATYVGSTIDPIDNTWASAKDEDGCFGTTTHKVVNATTLTAAPRALRIRPTVSGDFDGDLPKDYRAGGYKFAYRIDSEYVNYTVSFEKDYKFIIDKRTAQVRKMSAINYKDYDGTAPAIPDTDAVRNQIFVDTQGIAETVNTKDLVFTFTRDTEKLAEELSGLKNVDVAEYQTLFDGIAGDDTKAGYFKIEVTCKTTDNFNFQVDVQHYIIRRVRVGITLNNSTITLSKQFDTERPTATYDDLTVNKTVTDEVYIDLDTKFMQNGSNWVAYDKNGGNNVGVYAYKLETYFKINGKDYKIGLTDEITGANLLSWNYTYSITANSLQKPNECDGLYTISKKDVSVYWENAADKQFTVNTVTGDYYVYGKKYNNGSIAVADAAREMNEAYTIVDADGKEIDYEKLGFTKEDIALSGRTSVLNAGEYFSADISDLVASNSNFNIINNPILYAIEKLNVDLTLTYLYNGEQNVDYGLNVTDNFRLDYVLDFADKAVFEADVGIENANIEDWLSVNESDFTNNKFVTNTVLYYLKNSLGTNFNLAERGVILNAGGYTTYAEGIYALNFDFTIIPTDFDINKKELRILGAERDYFNKDSLKLISSIDGSVNENVEKTIVNAVFMEVIDETNVADNAGTNYFVYVPASELTLIGENYPNYRLVFDTAVSGNNQNIALTINKIPLSVTVKTFEGADIAISYGETVEKGIKLNLSYSGFPILVDCTDYNKETEQAAQNSVKAAVEEIINFGGIASELKSITASDFAYQYSLNDYVEGTMVTLDNYELNLDAFFVKVNKISLRLNLINPVGTRYDSDGRFSLIIDERGALAYSETDSGRLNYRFEFTTESLDAIIGYKEKRNELGRALTIYEILQLVWSSEKELPTDYGKLVAYTISQNGATDRVTAGAAKIKLTDNWYISDNYTLNCNESDAVIFPKATYLGEDIYNDLPFTSVSITGTDDYIIDADDFLKRLTMLVKVNFTGMPEGKESEWINIRTDNPSNNSVYGNADYARRFELQFADTAPETIQIGDVVKLKLVYIETFYVSTETLRNEITSKEFAVRMYAREDETVKDKNNSSFIDRNGNKFGFYDLVTANQTYELRDKDDVTESEWKYDIISTDFALMPNAGMTNYSFEIILYRKGTTSLVLGFKGGADNGGNAAYGYYTRLSYVDVNGETQRIETFMNSYTVNGSERSVLDDVNLFDGRKHTLDAYIDKIGYVSDGENGGTKTRYYRVKFGIDNRYFYSIDFEGGTVEEILNETQTAISDVLYTDFITFDGASAAGFIINECSAYVARFTLKSMGIAIAREDESDVVRDLRISPVEDGDVIYIEEGQSVEDMIEVLTVNSNEGYEGRYELVYSYTSINGQINGLASRRLTEGLYVATVKLNLDNAELKSVEFLLCVVKNAGEKITLKENGLSDNEYSPMPDNPVHMSGDGGLIAFAELGHSITYSRIVFDFKDKEGTDNGKATFILKSGDNEQTDLSQMSPNNAAEELRFRGVSVSVERSGNVYQTNIHLRLGDFYLCHEVATNVDWVGDGNVLTATYDSDNGIIIVSLTRGGAVLMQETVTRTNEYTLSRAQEIIKVSRYTGLQLYNQDMTVYAYETTETKQSILNMSDSQGHLVDAGNIVAENITFDATYGRVNVVEYYKLADSNGSALSTGANNLYLRFKASAGTNFRIMFINNTPDVTLKSNAEDERGAFLEIRTDYSDGFGSAKTPAVRLGYYKRGNLYAPQQIGVESKSLADGDEHTVRIELTTIENNLYNYGGEEAVPSWQVRIYIDGSDQSHMHIGYIPKTADLSHVPLYDNNAGGSNAQQDGNYTFASGVRYVGIMPISDGVIEIKEMILY